MKRFGTTTAAFARSASLSENRRPKALPSFGLYVIAIQDIERNRVEVFSESGTGFVFSRSTAIVCREKFVSRSRFKEIGCRILKSRLGFQRSLVHLIAPHKRLKLQPLLYLSLAPQNNLWLECSQHEPSPISRRHGSRQTAFERFDHAREGGRHRCDLWIARNFNSRPEAKLGRNRTWHGKEKRTGRHGRQKRRRIPEEGWRHVQRLDRDQGADEVGSRHPRRERQHVIDAIAGRTSFAAVKSDAPDGADAERSATGRAEWGVRSVTVAWRNAGAAGRSGFFAKAGAGFAAVKSFHCTVFVSVGPGGSERDYGRDGECAVARWTAAGWRWSARRAPDAARNGTVKVSRFADFVVDRFL